ncbi:MAG: hypothetical protein KF862_05745 [Chitinophagaceae bacterium]|nr:hypothetical protein [Chitinophagaceae bacterium]
MKEYLLLRNNAQSGPYTLDELRAIGLRAYDLVWIENKSFSWKYPSEISELAAFAPPLEEISVEPIGRELTHITVDVDDLARVLPVVKRESKENAAKIIPVQNIGTHVVALRPTINHIEIKTIKSASQPNVLKVQVREKDTTNIPSAEDVRNMMKVEVPEDNPSSVSVLNEAPIFKSSYFNQPVLHAHPHTGNKLEMIVLAIGAASLLAVIYLLLTTGYQY